MLTAAFGMRVLAGQQPAALVIPEALLIFR